MSFDDKAAEFIFGKNKVALFYIRSGNTTNHDSEFTKLANSLRGKIYVIICDIKTELEEKLAEYLGITAQNLPHTRIIDIKSDEDIRNYVLEGEISEKAILKFYEDYKNGVLTPYQKSQPIPSEKEENGITVVVGKNFEEIVNDSTKHVLMEYYAPWCGHCKSFLPIYEKVAEHFKSDPSIVVGKMDATANEVDGLTVTGYPTIKFYKKDDKSNPINFDGDREFEDVIEFVNEILFPGKFPKREKKAKPVHDHDHEHGHDHDHDHDHSHGHDHSHSHDHSHGHDHSHSHDHSHGHHDHTHGKHKEEKKAEL